jgi:flagellar biosynthesis protein FlhB
LFVLNRVTFDLAKLNPLAQFNLGTIVWKTVGTLTLLVVLGGVGFLLFIGMLNVALPLLLNGREYLLKWPQALLSQVVPVAALGLGLLGFFAWLVARFSFMLKHRMTPEEVLRDGSDSVNRVGAIGG